MPESAPQNNSHSLRNTLIGVARTAVTWLPTITAGTAVATQAVASTIPQSVPHAEKMMHALAGFNIGAVVISAVAMGISTLQVINPDFYKEVWHKVVNGAPVNKFESLSERASAQLDAFNTNLISGLMNCYSAITLLF